MRNHEDHNKRKDGREKQHSDSVYLCCVHTLPFMALSAPVFAHRCCFLIVGMYF